MRKNANEETEDEQIDWKIQYFFVLSRNKK